MALSIAGLLLLAACGSDSKTGASSGSNSGGAAAGDRTGVTDTTITISSVGSFSGPYAKIYDAVYQASTDTWAAEVNANGGINGRTVVVKKVDDKFSVEGAVGACKEIETNGSFAAFTQSLFPEGLDCLDKAGIPAQNTGIAGDPAQYQWTHIHSVGSNKDEGTALARYVGGPNGIAKPGSTVGLVYTADQPPMAATAAAFKDSAETSGLTVHEEKLSTGQASFTAEVQRLKDAGVQTVVMTATTEALGVLRDAAAISFAPKWVGQYFVADEFSLAAGPALFQGVTGRRGWATTDTPAWTKYLAIVNKNGKASQPPTTTGMSSYEALTVMQQALQLAGKDLTRESFLAAYKKIINFDTGGIPPVTYSDGQVAGATTAFTIECCQDDKTWKGTGPAS
jgi:ABC-type branched-subunit amino acid transport system substrate-binding protein